MIHTLPRRQFMFHRRVAFRRRRIGDKQKLFPAGQLQVTPPGVCRHRVCVCVRLPLQSVGRSDGSFSACSHVSRLVAVILRRTGQCVCTEACWRSSSAVFAASSFEREGAQMKPAGSKADDICGTSTSSCSCVHFGTSEGALQSVFGSRTERIAIA